jgi:hypothetical protein
LSESQDLAQQQESDPHWLESRLFKQKMYEIDAATPPKERTQIVINDWDSNPKSKVRLESGVYYRYTSSQEKNEILR